MRIGITYDLQEDYLREGYSEEQTAEFDSIETIETIEQALRSLGHSTDRIGPARSLIQRVARGDRWDMVFNIAEGLHGFGREALVPALLDSYRIPYTFSDPLTLSVALHKPTAKHIIRDRGILTPDFDLVEVVADVERVPLPFPLFVKPVAEGTSKGISAKSKVHDRSELRLRCETLLAQFHQPVLVETFLPGREFGVGIVGTGTRASVLGVMEIILQDDAEPEVYSYANKKHWKRCVRHGLINDEVSAVAEEIALRVWRALGCRDAGRVELRCDPTGRPNFIEVNPLTGLQVDSDLMILGQLVGISYRDLIERIVGSALDRIREQSQGQWG